MKTIIDSKLLTERINSFSITWNDVLPDLKDDWGHAARLMCSKLSAAWTSLGFVRGTDFFESETVGFLASITATIASKRMVCPEVVQAVISMRESIDPRIMVIVYGDAECDDDPDEDSEFTLVFEGQTLLGEFNRADDLACMLPDFS